MRKKNIARAGALLLGFAIAAAASAAEIPWELVEGADGLKGIYKEVVAEILETAPCYGDCEGTIADCLRADGGDKTAKRLAAFTVRRVMADNDVEEVLVEIESRRLSAFPETVHDPDLEGLLVSGNAGAKVRIILYADFGCPYCRATATALRGLIAAEPDRIAYYFKNYPLKSHDRAVPSALALLAADRQGKFWEMHDLLYADGDDLSDAYLEQCAASLGLDAAKFQADRKDKSLIDRLRAEKVEGQKLGVKKTPGILVNGKFYRGVRTWEELFDRIEEEFDLLDLGRSPK